ncbi:hypothetical protein ACIQNI_14875 [Streptomyces sp. NPDC091266]|uniref:hypothetical protein n=1 Tax=Streptomyces sp. NPDC091266 TaxID=3365978 RepID=UPI0037FB16AC
MRFSGLGYWASHVSEFGYSHGVLRGAVGTIAVLLASVLLGCALHRVDRIRRLRFAPAAAAVALSGVGVVWLATN